MTLNVVIPNQMALLGQSEFGIYMITFIILKLRQKVGYNRNMETIEIIRLPPEKWPEYKEIRLRSLKEEPQAFTVSYEEEENKPDAQWEYRLKHSLFVFAQANDRLVGIMSSYIDRFKKSSHIAHIVNVYVDKDYRGQGVGKRLLSELIYDIKVNTSIKKIETTVTVGQDAAIHLYKSLGFKEAGKYHKSLYHNFIYYDEILMELLID